MPNVRDYQDYVEIQRGYGWRPLDFITWFSWHINTPLSVIRKGMNKDQDHDC